METNGSIIRRIRKTLSKRGYKATVQRDAWLVPVKSPKEENQEGNYEICKFMACKRAGQRL